MKVLGMLWDIYGNQISIPVKDCAAATIYNTRQILRETVKVFNPLGYFSPVLVHAKLFLRDLWKNGLDWDEIISPEQIAAGKTYRKNFNLSAM